MASPPSSSSFSSSSAYKSPKAALNPAGKWTEERRARSDKAILIALSIAQSNFEKARNNSNSAEHSMHDAYPQTLPCSQDKMYHPLRNKSFPSDTEFHSEPALRGEAAPGPGPPWQYGSHGPFATYEFSDTLLDSKTKSCRWAEEGRGGWVDAHKKWKEAQSTASVYFRNQVASFGSVAIGNNSRHQLELCNPSNETVSFSLVVSLGLSFLIPFRFLLEDTFFLLSTLIF